MSNPNTYPRESVEFVPVTITVDGTPVTQGVEFSVVPAKDRAAEWSLGVLIAGKVGFMIGDYPVGTYRIWTRITLDPEVVVIDAGTFFIN